MARLSTFEHLIAYRYLRAKRRVGLISIISIISIAGIAIGVAALVVVLSVFNGFNSFAVRQIVGFDPHIRISPRTATTFNSDSVIRLLRIPEMESASSFIAGRSAIIHESVTQVALIRGVEIAESRAGAPPEVADELTRSEFGEETPPIVLGSLLAQRLDVLPGDDISVVGRKGLELALTQAAQPTTVPVKVTGTFSLNQEYDEHVAFTTLTTARKLFDVPEGEMGIDVRIHDFKDAEFIARELKSDLGPDVIIETWQDLHRDLYGAMELERWSAFAILLFIIIVAVFNVLGMLTMTVIEKRRDIGILKSLGASERGIMKIYLFEGGMIGIIGTLGGTLLGLLVCWLQQTFQLVRLDTSSYLLPAIPVEVHPVDIFLVAMTALLLATCSAIYPALRAARIRTAEAVRWE